MALRGLGLSHTGFLGASLRLQLGASPVWRRGGDSSNLVIGGLDLLPRGHVLVHNCQPPFIALLLICVTRRYEPKCMQAGRQVEASTGRQTRKADTRFGLFKGIEALVSMKSDGNVP